MITVTVTVTFTFTNYEEVSRKAAKNAKGFRVSEFQRFHCSARVRGSKIQE